MEQEVINGVEDERTRQSREWEGTTNTKGF